MKELCVYGCGQEAKYQLKNGKWCCESSSNKCKALILKRKLSGNGIHGIKRLNEISKIKLICEYCGMQCGSLVYNKHVQTCKLNLINIALLEKRKNKLDHICENCRDKHNGLFGSGRFCSHICSSNYSTKYENNWNKEFKCTICENITLRSKRARKNSKIILCDSCKQLSLAQQKYELYKRNIKYVKCKTCDNIILENNKYGLCRSCLRKSEEYRQRISKSCVGKCGGFRLISNSHRGKSGMYKGYWCQSSWELAWIIHALDHNIKFERNTKRFWYEYENKQHYYVPDFILEDGSYVEIKGYYNVQDQTKTKYFTEKLDLIDKNKIHPILKYVIDKYGKEFVQLYEK